MLNENCHLVFGATEAYRSARAPEGGASSWGPSKLVKPPARTGVAGPSRGHGSAGQTKGLVKENVESEEEKDGVATTDPDPPRV